VQPMPVRRPWFSGWNSVWPVAAVFAALVLIAVLVRKGGGNAPPTQIAEAHPPEKRAVVGGVAPAQAGLPAARGASPLPTAKDRSIDTLQVAKPAAGKAAAEPKVEDQSVADLPLNNLPLSGRNPQSLPPSAAAPTLRAMAGMGGGGGGGRASESESGSAQQAQIPGGGIKQQSSGTGSAVVQPPAASPAPTLPPPPAAVARAGRGSAPAEGASMSAAASGDALDALSDDAVAVEPASNASAAVISAPSLPSLALTGNIALPRLPSALPALSVAAAGQTMLALDSGNALFLSGDGGKQWKRVRAKWQGRAVKVALTVTPVGQTQQPVAVNKPAIRGELQGRISTATAATAAAAQPAAAGSATLTGQVTDPVGAAIPGAAVTLTNAVTAAAVTVKTDAAGLYSAGGLAAGVYRVDAAARGFAKQNLTVTLAASQQGNADLRLQVGQTSETVTVTSAAPQVETENSLSDEVLQSKRKQVATPVFAITTDKGERWVSADGRSWKRE